MGGERTGVHNDILCILDSRPHVLLLSLYWIIEDVFLVSILMDVVWCRYSIFRHPIIFYFSSELRTERVCDIRGRISHKIGRIRSKFSRRSQGKEIFQVSFYTVAPMLCSTTCYTYFTWRFYLIF